VSGAYRFVSFEVQPDRQRLIVEGNAVTLGSRAFDVLLVLAERAGELVSKNELLDRVWPGVAVEENNLQVQISTLRKLLGPQAIATIPGRGYRLTAARRPTPPELESPASTTAAVFGNVPVDTTTQPGTGAATAGRAASGASLHDAADEAPALFGRDEDLALLSDLVRQQPLVTVVGPSGIGKTRIAQCVARGLRDEFVHGVRIVDLAPLAQCDLVVGTVARALGVVVNDIEHALELTAQAVAGQHLLLVLDNCEHLLDEIDKVVTALRKDASTIRILATSQELLRHSDEHVYRLGPLALPAEVTPKNAGDAGAVQLFVARVQALDTRFRLNDQNVDAIVDICRRLDGIPLAIELAAARVPLLGVEGLRERLGERFRLLTAGARLALRRHQTLRAALEWSYGLLSPDEQRVFDKLGVFAGSFSLESAQKVAADEGIDEWAVLDHLGALVDKSLVGVEPGPTARYRMLETTRAFALEHLAARGSTSDAMRRHAEVMLALFESYYDDVWAGASPQDGVEQLAPDLDNLRGALGWASDAAGDRRTAVALIGAVASGGFLHFAGLKLEAWQWCQRLRPFVDASIPPAIAARFWHASAEQGGYFSPAVSIEDAKRAVALYDELDDRLRRYFARLGLAYSLLQTGAADDARRVLDQARALRDPAFAPRLRSIFDNHAALVLTELGELSEARMHALEFLKLARQLRSPIDETIALSILVDLDIAEGKGIAAAADEMLVRYRASPQEFVRGEGGLNSRRLASALVLADRLDEAEVIYRNAVSVLRRSQGTAAPALYDAAWLVARRGRLHDAARVFAYAEAVLAGRGIKPRPLARQIRDRLLVLLAAEMPAETLERLFDEGRRLSDGAACAIAFPPIATA
jgi:predicted ATPase/DNA-binding winged helix-turn-helix (wHTH) protein